MATFFTIYLTNSVFRTFDNDTRAMALSVVAIIILLTRILDGLADLGMGFIMERTRFKSGKARPWLIIFIWPLAAVFVALFNVPYDMSVIGKIIYVSIFYNLVFTFFYTGVAVPYNTLLATITRDRHERGVVTIIRMGLGALSMAASTGMVYIFEFFPDGEGNPVAWTVFNIMCTVFLVASVVVTYFTQREIHYEAEKKEKIDFKTGMRALARNKYFILITLFSTMFYISGALTQSANAHYSKYILGNLGDMVILMVASFAPMVIAFPFLPKLMEKYGKRQVCLAGLAVSVLTCFIYFINPYSLGLAAVGLLFRNLGLMPTNVMFMASIADTIEYGEWKTGVRTEGLINSAASFGMKIGTGVGGAIILWTLAAVGFDADLDTQTPLANNALIALMIALPVVFYAIMWVLMYFFKLDKEYDKVIKELAERKKA
jgi:GPH family glycoside/pentoside/hexuronide:cation symporter